VRIAYLGPAGTFSEEALRRSGFATSGFIPVPCDTIPEVIESIGADLADRALAPIENSIEGSIRGTLDGLVDQADQVSILGEYDLSIRSALISREAFALDTIEAVISHPQPLAQCARFLRTELPGAQLKVADSTSSAVREVAGSDQRWAALAPASAAALYGCQILREGIEDEPGNVTRFVWLGEPGTEPVSSSSEVWKTTLVFSELGADHPGALVDALLEFSTREINLVRIESRPRRRELGSYLFFLDVEGKSSDSGVAAAIEGLRSKAESVMVLGSYPGSTADSVA
jgi:prephenate dehydratase